jgi:exodeoxyribonuclease V beta subunit
MQFQPFLAYSASAGSGKTFALAVRYISLLFMDESPASILAATFTNKAAAEMRQRVIDSLRNLGENEAFLEAVCTQTGLEREVLFAKQPEVLGRFLASASHIVTLDSFFASILRSASLELGLEPDFLTKEEAHEDMDTHFLAALKREGLLNDLVHLSLDIEDKRLTRIFALMEQFYKVDPLLPTPQTEVPAVAKLEAVAEEKRLAMVEMLKEEGASARAVKQFETTSLKALFDKGLFEKASLGEHSWFKKVATPAIEVLYSELKRALSQWVKAKEAMVLVSLFKIYDHYKNALIDEAKGKGVLSFDDLTYFTYRLLHESISKEFLYFKIDARFKHILLDEFQDTSTLQFLLLKPLIDEIFSGEGQSELRSFFYVGDTKQSLYRFRGGVEELFDKVAERYGVCIEQMDTNYRSSREVVAQVNRWFKSAMPGYVAQKSRPGAREGYVEVVENEAPLEEAVTQAKRLLSLGVDVDEIAFLVSTNKDGQALQEVCAQAGIHTLLKTSSSLKHLPKIAALAAMVSYLYSGERLDAEAMLQRVGKSLEEVDMSWYMPYLTPLQIIDRLVREFGYFDNDPNILKLLEFAASYATIPDFLEAFETSSVAVASHSVHGAKIMTVHGSKGLEFGYVIVLDRLTRPRADTAPLIFHYSDDLTIDTILYRTANREHFDADYAAVLEERRQSAQKDRMNVLYVALTRAVEALIVIRKPKQSVFDEIGMEVMHSGTLLPMACSDEEKTREQSISEVQIGTYGIQEKAESADEEERDIEAIRFGIALHYALEMLGAFTPDALEEAMTAMQNRYGQMLEKAQIEDIRQRITRLLTDARFMQLLEGAKIGRERALSYRGELKQIDLLLEYDDHALVIDYKSSAKYENKHRAQVRYYMQAIETLTGKPTEGMLIYLEKEENRFISLI